MDPRAVLVVGETPSLGRSVVDLLESANVPCRFVYDVSAGHPLASLSDRFPVVVAACNEHFCATARRWSRGEFPNVQLVVVGSRDPTLLTMPEVRVVPLPLLPGPLLALTATLLASAESARRADASGAASWLGDSAPR